MIARVWSIAVVVCLALTGEGLTARAVSAEPSRETESVYDRERLDALYRKLRLSQSAREARAAASEIWRVWTEGPDEQAGEQVLELFRARRARDLDKALEIANDLTERRPDYAEGWNQKATILFEMGRYDRSLETVEKVLELEPKHFGALAGKALMLHQQGRVELGQKALRRAVEIHPFLAERHLLVDKPDERI